MKKTFALVLVLAILATSCTNMNRTQQGALSGAAIGAAAGAGISYLTGGRFMAGALLGGALGAVGGGIYGHEQQKKTKK
jgi:hypothetical protein